jgi:transcriptional regulator with XRE-family HTH domain
MLPTNLDGLGRFIVARRQTKKTSQAQLAQLAGVSNRTIVEYERGTFGDNERRLYTTLVRLALALEDDPREWIKAAGLKYSPTLVKSVVELAKQRSPTGSMAAYLASISTRGTLEELLTSNNPIIRAACIPGRNDDLFREHFRLLCKFANPEWKVEFREFDNYRDYDAAITSENKETRCHVGLGALETPSHVARGLRFIHNPGCYRHLGTVWCPAPESTAALTWAAVFDRQGPILALTIKDEAGDQHLRALCGYRETDGVIKSIEKRDLEELTRLFLDETKKNPHRAVIICAIETKCQQIIEGLPPEWKARSLSSGVTTLPSSEDDYQYAPRFRVGFYVRQDDTAWAQTLSDAQEVALRDAPYKLAKLYAEAISDMTLSRREDDISKIINPWLIDSVRFREYLFSELEQALKRKDHTGRTDWPDRVSAISKRAQRLARWEDRRAEWFVALDKIAAVGGIETFAGRLVSLADRLEAVLPPPNAQLSQGRELHGDCTSR